ncbi:MAG: glycosyltransferase, partial [Thermoguttaceae bacterium]|nr:glycosyltransferase [Thermoguttaceae bacterium]
MQYVPFAVLMPLYNHEQDLPRAIESVLKQKTDFQYRLVIIDDKSTDNGLTVAKKYQAENPDRIEIIENEKNLGLLWSIARVYADLNCDYFAVLDPDDYYTVDDKFQRALSFLEEHPDFTCYFAN